MKNKKEIMKELSEKFLQEKKRIGFKASFEDLDEVFYLKDSVLSAGFVSDGFSRQLCHRIIDTYNGWVGYLHGLLMANPSNMLNQTEGKLFQGQEDRNKIWNLLKEIMYFSSLNSLVGISKDVSKEREFIDGALAFWKERFKPGILVILEKVNDGWGEKVPEKK